MSQDKTSDQNGDWRLGYCTDKGEEVVNHKDGDPRNNSIDNLEILPERLVELKTRLPFRYEMTFPAKPIRQQIAELLRKEPSPDRDWGEEWDQLNAIVAWNHAIKTVLAIIDKAMP